MSPGKNTPGPDAEQPEIIARIQIPQEDARKWLALFNAVVEEHREHFNEFMALIQRGALKNEENQQRFVSLQKIIVELERFGKQLMGEIAFDYDVFRKEYRNAVLALREHQQLLQYVLEHAESPESEEVAEAKRELEHTEVLLKKLHALQTDLVRHFPPGFEGT